MLRCGRLTAHCPAQRSKVAVTRPPISPLGFWFSDTENSNTWLLNIEANAPVSHDAWPPLAPPLCTNVTPAVSPGSELARCVPRGVPPGMELGAWEIRLSGAPNSFHRPISGGSGLLIVGSLRPISEKEKVVTVPLPGQPLNPPLSPIFTEPSRPGDKTES